MRIGERLLGGDRTMATAWNFGPADDDTRPVGWIVERILRLWGSEGWDRPDGLQLYEAMLLKLDCAKARSETRLATGNKSRAGAGSGGGVAPCRGGRR